MLDDFQKYGEIARTLLVPIIGYLTYILRDIRGQLQQINGRLIDLERWRQEHAKWDDDHHQQVDQALTRLENRMDHARWRDSRGS